MTATTFKTNRYPSRLSDRSHFTVSNKENTSNWTFIIDSLNKYFGAQIRKRSALFKVIYIISVCAKS